MRQGLPSSGLMAGVLLLAATACSDPPTSLPPTTPLALESSTLFSGGEGVLVSEAFRSIDLVALKDSLGEIPRRWSNFQVLFAGDTVDSWRVSEDRIGFRVPPSYSGDYEVAIRTPTYAAEALLARVIGAVPGYGPGWYCVGGFYGTEFVPLGPEELLLWTSCSLFRDPTPKGIVRLTPGTMFQAAFLTNPEDWIDELWFNTLQDWGDSFRSMWAAGPSVRPGHAVVERYPDTVGDSSSTWIWRFGSDPEPVEPIDCLPPDGWGYAFRYTAAEIAPGVCLSVTVGADFYLNGSELLVDAPIDLSWPASFRVASNGTAALRNVKMWRPQGTWPVFRPGEGVAYAVNDYSVVKDVAFSPAGDSMYVAAVVRIGEDERLVLDVRETETGVLLDRLEWECQGRCAGITAAVARDAEHLWTLRWVTVDDDQWTERQPLVEDDRQLRVELRDPADLTVLRSVAVPEHLGSRPSSVAVGSHPVLLPDATGRRVYILGEYYLGHSAAGYLMELF